MRSCRLWPGLVGCVAAFSTAALPGCQRRPPPIIEVAYPQPTPGVRDVAQQELAAGDGGSPATFGDPFINVSDDPAEDIHVAGRIVAIPGVVAVVGHTDSRGTLLAAPVYDEAGIPLVVPTGTSRRLRTTSPWVFMLAPDDSTEGAFIAGFAAHTLGAHSVVLFYDNDEYGRGLRDGLRTALPATGLELEADEPIGAVCSPSQPPGGDALIAIATPRRRSPDVVVIAARTRDAVCVGRQVAARLPGIRLIVGDAVDLDSQFIHAMGAAADSVYAVTFWHPGLPGDASLAFVRAYRRVVGATPGATEAMLYDAELLLAEAVRAVGPHRSAVRKYLRTLGSTRPSYAGVTGAISFGPTAQRPLYMLHVHGDSIRQVAGP